MQFAQQQQQYQMFELFLSRFNNSNNKPNIAYNSPGNYSPTVANAMSAVSGAYRQQGGTVSVLNPESVTFKTPKILAEMKLMKERQMKQMQQRQIQQQQQQVVVTGVNVEQSQQVQNNIQQQQTQQQIIATSGQTVQSQLQQVFFFVEFI